MRADAPKTKRNIEVEDNVGVNALENAVMLGRLSYDVSVAVRHDSENRDRDLNHLGENEQQH